VKGPVKNEERMLFVPTTEEDPEVYVMRGYKPLLSKL
jgi:hypothetical protein